MWAYVDESGNTGNRIFDGSTPVHYRRDGDQENFDLVFRTTCGDRP